MEEGINPGNNAGIPFIREGMPAVDIRRYSPGALAYLGDGVYEILVRSMIVAKGNRPADDLQSMGSHYAKAVSQAAAVNRLLEQGVFSEEETEVYKRGRNSDTHTHIRNASRSEYQKATGLEALFGYLYLIGRYDRLQALFDRVVAAIDEVKA
ncbi:MAG: ribonuclease III [Lachnospiraceae bacterium]|nr:ribonuclease III [Lachnospiraceae bacterium]